MNSLGLMCTSSLWARLFVCLQVRTERERGDSLTLNRRGRSLNIKSAFKMGTEEPKCHQNTQEMCICLASGRLSEYERINAQW